jgi:hypothetical protein
MRRKVVATLLTLMCVAPPSLPAMASPVLGSAALEAQATPDDALQALTGMLGFSYAGDCVTARSPEDIGRVCTTFVDEQGGVRAYIAGRTFSEYSLWLFIQEGSTGWQPAGTAPFDFFAPTLDPPWPVGP